MSRWLSEAGQACLSAVLQDERTIQPLTYGRISSYYYLKHQSIRTFKERLKPEMSVQELLTTLAVRLCSSP